MPSINQSMNDTSGNFSEPELGDDWFVNSWIYSQVINIILLFITLFMFVALIVFGSSNNKLRWKQSKNGSARLIIIALTTIFMTIMTLIVAQAVLVVDKLTQDSTENDRICELVMDVSIVVYIVSYALTYVFLWYRMEKLYSQPSLRRLRTRVVKGFSYTVIILIFFGALVHATILIHPNNHRMHNSRCKQDKVVSIFAYAAYGIKSVSNTILFCLFYYPLRLHKKHSLTLVNPSRGRNGVNTARRLLRAIRLATISTISCVTSDLIITLLDSELLPKLAPGHFINTIWDINLLINVISIVICFDGFRKKALDSFRTRGKSLRSTTSAYSQGDGEGKRSSKYELKSSPRKSPTRDVNQG